MVLESGNLTKSNLFSKSFANLFVILSNTDNVPDPLNDDSTRQFVYSRFPDVTNMKFEGYPFIVLMPTDLNNSEFNLDQGSSKHEFSFMLEIYCTDRIRSKEGRGNYSPAIEYVDQITDSIIKTLLNQTNRRVLDAYGFGVPQIETQSIDTTEIDGDLIWVRRILISSKKRLRTGI